jgi:hypothetical protein
LRVCMDMGDFRLDWTGKPSLRYCDRSRSPVAPAMQSNRLVDPLRLPENIVQATRAACRNRTSPNTIFVIRRRAK